MADRVIGPLDHYQWSKPFGSERHYWRIVTRGGGVTFHVSINEKYGDTAGLEFHHSEPPRHMHNDPPSHTDCEVTGGRCWHDGTSLYASETLWPQIRRYLERGNHEGIFQILHREARERGLCGEPPSDERYATVPEILSALTDKD